MEMTIRLFCMCLFSTTVVDSRLIRIHANHEGVDIDIEDNPTRHFIHDPASGRDSGSDVHAAAPPCDRSKCKLPDCRCVGTDIPGNLSPADTPQIVVLTFGKQQRPADIPAIREILDGRKNPNGCPISATFFPIASGAAGGSYYYSNINLFYSLGHEIALGGASASGIVWPNASKAEWQEMMEDEIKMLSSFAAIPKPEMKGWRTPDLHMGGDRMFSAIKDSGLMYDSTRGATRVGDKPNLYWPFTYDYSTDAQTCPITPCPTESYPGVWGLLPTAQKCPDGHQSATLDGCTTAITEDQAYEVLNNGFQEHYKGNRAPIVLNMGLQWLLNNRRRNGTIRFLDTILKQKDVFVVSGARALAWVRHPQRVADKPSAFECKTPPPARCPHHMTCMYDANMKHTDQQSGAVYTTDMCTHACPACYPVYKDPLGTSHCLKL